MKKVIHNFSKLIFMAIAFILLISIYKKVTGHDIELPGTIGMVSLFLWFMTTD